MGAACGLHTAPLRERRYGYKSRVNESNGGRRVGHTPPRRRLRYRQRTPLLGGCGKELKGGGVDSTQRRPHCRRRGNEPGVDTGGQPPTLGGLKELKRGGGRVHAAPFSTLQE